MEDLSADDDILSDILLDNLEFEPTISTHKMNPQYRGQRFDRNTVSLIVRNRIVVQKDVAAAIDDLCKLGIIKKYLTNKTQRQIASFHAHARRYLESYLPDSGVEFALTTRYKRVMMSRLAKETDVSELDQQESSSSKLPDPQEVKPKIKGKARSSLDRAASNIGAASTVLEKADVSVLAMRSFKPGEIINYCKGGLKDLSKSEDDALREEATSSKEKRKENEYKGVLGPGRDFSVIRSARKGCSQLLLGPARFLNHDCNPNTDFYRMGSTMLFKVIRPIQRNEEITTYYGDNYFEWANSECMCATCELRGTGAFTVALPDVVPKEEESSSSTVPAPAEVNGRQSTRRSSRPSGLSSSLPSPSPTPPITPSWSTHVGDDLSNDKKSKRDQIADLKLAEHGPSEDRSDPWVEGAGPKCRCLTCGATFWAPEKWWTPDECQRCERHYKIFKADWPSRVPTEGLLARKGGVKHKASSEMISDPVSLRSEKPRSVTPTSASASVSAAQAKSRARAPKAVSASPRVASEHASPKPAQSAASDASTPSTFASRVNAKGKPAAEAGNGKPAPTAPKVATPATLADPYGLDSDGSELTPEPDSDREQVFEEDDDEDQGPRPPVHGSRSTEFIRSSSSSPGPTGPKMLGKNAKTDVLAQYWGAPVGDRRARRKPSSTGGPELLGLRRESQDLAHKAKKRRTSFRDSETEEVALQRHLQRRLVAATDSDAEDGSPNVAPSASGPAPSKHRKTPSMGDLESMQNHVKSQIKASAQVQGSSSSAVSDPHSRSVGAEPRPPAQSAEAEGTTERASDSNVPELATSGTERTSESNLALFWSAGVEGTRQRRQAQREPINIVSPTVSGKRQRQTPESSRSQTPDLKRSRGRHPVSVGTDEEGSSKDRSGRSRSVAFSEPDGDKRSSRGASDMDEDDEKPVLGQQTVKSSTVDDESAKERLLPSAVLFRPPGFARPDLAAAAARSSSPLAGPPRAGQPMRKNLRWGSGKTSLSRPLTSNGLQSSPLGRPLTSLNGPRSSPRTEEDVSRTPQLVHTASMLEHSKALNDTPMPDRTVAASAPPEVASSRQSTGLDKILDDIKPVRLPMEPLPVHDILEPEKSPKIEIDISVSQAEEAATPTLDSVNVKPPILAPAEAAVPAPMPPSPASAELKMSSAALPVSSTAEDVTPTLVEAPTPARTADEAELPTALLTDVSCRIDAVKEPIVPPAPEDISFETVPMDVNAEPTPMMALEHNSRRASGRARKAPEMAAGQIPYKGSLVRLAAQRAKTTKGSAVNSLANSPSGTASPDSRLGSPKTTRTRKSLVEEGTPTKTGEQARDLVTSANGADEVTDMHVD